MLKDFSHPISLLSLGKKDIYMHKGKNGLGSKASLVTEELQ